MKTMEHQTLEFADIKETLDSLGFKLRDQGAFWHTCAIWRNGDNPTAVQIYKDSGVWKDFVEQTPHLPFYKLVAKALGTADSTSVKKYIKDHGGLTSFERDTDNRRKITMDKTYPVSTLSKLLPHHQFYLDKKISTKTIEMYKGGYCTSDKMNGRYIFPVFQKDNPDAIIGFTGRHLRHDSNSNLPKWKHIGTRKNWLYPLYLPVDGKYPFFNSFKDKKEIVIVESVGDSLALTENGFLNHLVTFGLEISNKQICELLAVNPSRIIISSNNDFNSKTNAGKIAAVKNFIKLTDFFDPSKLIIKLPLTNDLCDLHIAENFDSWVEKDIDQQKQINFIIKQLKSSDAKTIIKSQSKLSSKISLLEEYVTT